MESPGARKGLAGKSGELTPARQRGGRGMALSLTHLCCRIPHDEVVSARVGIELDPILPARYRTPSQMWPRAEFRTRGPGDHPCQAKNSCGRPLPCCCLPTRAAVIGANGIAAMHRSRALRRRRAVPAPSRLPPAPPRRRTGRGPAVRKGLCTIGGRRQDSVQNAAWLKKQPFRVTRGASCGRPR
jgi:hypothetical protein